MSILPPKVTLKEIASNPMAYALCILCALVGWSVNWATGSNDKILEDKNKTIEKCEEISRKKDSIIIHFYERQLNEYRRDDSTKREILLKGVRELLKNK